MQKKADNGEKIVSSANGLETLVYPYAKKMNLGPYLSPHIKIISKGIKDKCKI